MNPVKTSSNSIITSILTILCSAAFTIAIHAIMPASVDVGKLDSFLVTLFGFPIVAASYFGSSLDRVGVTDKNSHQGHTLGKLKLR
ncbi:MAG: hypothetical protein PHZ11_11025 [Desulfitobacteriaceae bacterium]|nr:hypothetical protein [Desulfitobacteriaceae bacterium]MDD4402918.1 hypothetical protein [Desulfitobacteriaceae bacterium]